MAFETQVEVAFDQQFAVNRAVRAVTNDATFPQRLVLEYERAGLLAVTFGAALVQSRHRQAASRPKDVSAMRIMTLHAIHAAFRDWMVLRKTELSVDVQMTLETGGWVST